MNDRLAAAFSSRRVEAQSQTKNNTVTEVHENERHCHFPISMPKQTLSINQRPDNGEQPRG